MDEKQKKEKLEKAKNEAIKDEIPTHHLSWIPFIIAFAFMIPVSLWLYPGLWVKMFLAIEIHSNTILSSVGLIIAGALFIKFDNWLRSINQEISTNTKTPNQISKKLNEIKSSGPDLYDIKLEPHFNAFAKRNREFSPKSKVQYRHEKTLGNDEMSKLDAAMPHWGGTGEGESMHGSSTRYGSTKKSARR